MITATFQRVGQRGSDHPGSPPAPEPLVINSTDPTVIERELRAYVRPFLGSRSYGVIFELQDGGTEGEGWVEVGFRTAGTFTLTATKPVLASTAPGGAR